MIEIGVTDTLLFTIGIPNSVSISLPTLTKSLAELVILSYILEHALSISGSMQSSKDIPIVMVLISNFSSSIIFMVSKILLTFISYPPIIVCAWN
ncbi:hypothetical protein D3C81_1629290 [compost metagenome]